MKLSKVALALTTLIVVFSASMVLADSDARKSFDLLPPELVAVWTERIPQLRPQLVPAVNHYTILFDRQGAAAVARAITTTAA